jgi:hypothetical protein
MAKGGSKKAGGSSVTRDGTTGQYTVGRASFGSISAVEGIRMSKDMRGEFLRTERMSADKRRAVLSAKYGKIQ